MYPTIQEGCSIVHTTDWNGESSLDGEVVAYNPQYIDATVIGDMNGWYAHTVVKEYEDYSMNNSRYNFDEIGLVIEDYNEDLDIRVDSDQEFQDVKNLEGEHVLIMKGDANEHIDSEIVADEQVLSKINPEFQIYVLSLDTYPCSIFD